MLDNSNKKRQNIVDFLIFVLGIILTITLYRIHSYEPYYAQMYVDIGGSGTALHEPIFSGSLLTVGVIMAIAIFSYVVLRIKKLALPPLAIVLCMSGMLIGGILSMVWIVQITRNLWDQGNFYFVIFPLNYMLCCIRLSMQVIKEYEPKEQKTYQNKILNKCNELLQESKNWPIAVLIGTIPILLTMIAILVLFGQRPDAIIRAFTQTSDWTLSTKISPPTIERDAHYLCTVSLKGHQKIVKPIRYGIRKEHKIVVNRQLCVANAFEDFIQEKLPKTHHGIRHVYDTYGYPLSKHITTPVAADITYFIMKPLEYFFVAFLYLFDKNPENRIAVQYLPRKKEILAKTNF